MGPELSGERQASGQPLAGGDSGRGITVLQSTASDAVDSCRWEQLSGHNRHDESGSWSCSWKFNKDSAPLAFPMILQAARELVVNPCLIKPVKMALVSAAGS